MLHTRVKDFYEFFNICYIRTHTCICIMFLFYFSLSKEGNGSVPTSPAPSSPSASGAPNVSYLSYGEAFSNLISCLKQVNSKHFLFFCWVLWKHQMFRKYLLIQSSTQPLQYRNRRNILTQLYNYYFDKCIIVNRILCTLFIKEC